VRVCVLAIDGLEYSLVLKWKLKHLMQEYFGRHVSPIDPEHGKPMTPMCWASFITGKPPKVHGVRTFTRWGIRFIDKIRFYPPFTWIKGKRRLLMKLGIKPKPSGIPKNIKTIFDVVKPSIPLFIPSYNEPVELRDKFLHARKGEFLKKLWDVHRYRKEVFFRYLRGSEWKLLMCWFDLVDMASHAYINPRHKLVLMRVYLEANKLAREVREIVGRDTAVLVASDHGFEKKPDGSFDHSNYGFWSLNVEPPFRPRKITDFYNLILEVVRL